MQCGHTVTGLGTGEVGAALASLGRDGVADLVERSCRLARRFAGGLETAVRLSNATSQ